MQTGEYLKRIVSHNASVLVNKIRFAAYVAVDQIKCKWFVLSGKGTKGDYHLSMCSKDLMMDERTIVWMTMYDLVHALRFSDDRIKTIMPSFATNTCFFNLEMVWFVWQDKLDAIKTGDDLFKAAALMGFIDRKELIAAFSLAKFNTLRSAHIADVRHLLKK